MKFLHSLLLFGAAVLAAPTTGTDAETEVADTSSKRYVVLLKDEVTDVTSHINSLHLNVPILAKYEGAIKGYTGMFNAVTMALIHADPLVSVIQEDQEFEATAEQRLSGYGLAISSQLGPLAPGNQDNYFYSYTGAGVIVYVIDSGIIPNNPDFGGRAQQVANFVTRQYGNADEPNIDLNGHGTSVAGCVGGINWGTAKLATMRGVKALNAAGRGSTAGIVGAINYAINTCGNNKCVINLSLGGPTDYALNNAATVAHNRGLTVIAAAGNDNRDACFVSPAGAPAVITVAAIDSNYQRAPFSNFGQCVETFSPGYEIRTDTFRYPHPVSHLINGTSFSSPYVAGIAAYYLSAGATGPAQVRALLRQYGRTGLVGNANGSPNIIANNGYFNGLN